MSCQLFSNHSSDVLVLQNYSFHPLSELDNKETDFLPHLSRLTLSRLTLSRFSLSRLTLSRLTLSRITLSHLTLCHLTRHWFALLNRPEGSLII